MEIINNQKNHFNPQNTDALNNNLQLRQGNPPPQNPRVLAQDNVARGQIFNLAQAFQRAHELGRLQNAPVDLADVDYMNNQMLNNHPELRREQQEQDEPRGLIFNINEAFRRAHDEGRIAARRNNHMRVLEPMIR